jgi:protoheme IX farnesyltransferase
MSEAVVPAALPAIPSSASDRPLPGRSRLAAYVALTKPRIIELLLVTTVPAMIVAERGMPPAWLILATLVGGTLAAGGANATNMVIDRDIDKVMRRTRKRPLVTGEITPRNALIFAVALEVLAAVWLTLVVNPLSAVLAVAATLFYVLVYTMWLKRTSTQNIVIGGAAGAVPVLVGWAAVTNELAVAPFAMFAIIFAWTPPHFWALAIRYREDYAAAEVPMLPVVASFDDTAKRIVAYTVVLWAVSLAFWPLGAMGPLYLASAVVLGAMFTWKAVKLARSHVADSAMKLFKFSITYITLLFGAMAADQLLLP